MKFKLFLKIISVFLFALLLIVGLYYLFSYLKISQYQKAYAIENEEFLEKDEYLRLHFLNTGSSDCIIIESNGLFAMVDSAEDSDNPRQMKNLEFKGYEDEVVDYLKKIAADKDGKVTLEWVLGTHAHSDHIGGFDTIILHDDIIVKKAFLKEYDEDYIRQYEIKRWDNKEVYLQMYNACIEKGVDLIQDLPNEPWGFGEFSVQFFNIKPIRDLKVGENENSVGTLLEIKGHRIFLSADLNNLQKAEAEISKIIGEVDVLKAGHHGYYGSNTIGFIRKISPKITIVTSGRPAFRMNFISALALISKRSSVYSTGENNGLILDFSGDEIIITNNIH